MIKRHCKVIPRNKIIIIKEKQQLRFVEEKKIPDIKLSSPDSGQVSRFPNCPGQSRTGGDPNYGHSSIVRE